MMDVLIRLGKLDKGHNTAPKFKKTWVRKIDIIHLLRGERCLGEAFLLDFIRNKCFSMALL